MRKAFKFRLYPNRKQRAKLEETLEVCRVLYNTALAERRSSWEREGRSMTYHMQAMALPSQRESYWLLQWVHSQVLQDVLRRVDKAFKNFFRQVVGGEKSGYPRFRGHSRYDSFTYPQFGFGVVNRKLYLSKIGEVNIKIHRPLGGVVKTCTIKRDVDRWYACFTVEMPTVGKVQPLSAVGGGCWYKTLSVS